MYPLTTGWFALFLDTGANSSIDFSAQQFKLFFSEYNQYELIQPDLQREYRVSSIITIE